MIEIVFNESAEGCLKVAQSFGKGKYRGGPISVFIRKKDGSEPTEEEKEAALQEAREKERIAWERAIPLGGNSRDVFCLGQSLSIGDISENEPGEKRKQSLYSLHSIYPEEYIEEIVPRIMDKLKMNMEVIRERSTQMEPIRIWYSAQPDELCGMYWFMNQLLEMESHGSVYVVKLPEWEERESGEIIHYAGWGELGPEEWGRYVSLQKEVSHIFIKGCAAVWKTLQTENAPLRAMVNGRLVSMPENLYDSFLIREIEAEEETFSEAKLIGRLLGKYPLGINDSWYSLRIDEMVKAGYLEIAEEAPAGEVGYRRKLRKRS